ncbi:MAG: glycine dehydrogenase subunit 2, partial [Syntrophomonadaceae bacterium]|nr:glycine dehydrogenase subunit 2 [Syntrophomonadaceae bacterium]
PEPCESYSKDDLDEWCGVMKAISDECYNNPEVMKGAPHNGPTHRVKNAAIDDEKLIAATWRQYKKKFGK